MRRKWMSLKIPAACGCARASLAVLWVMLLAAGPGAAQTARELATQGPGELRQALREKIQELQSVTPASAKDGQLRQEIIEIVKSLDPPPAIPEEARRRAIRAQFAMKSAQSPDQYVQALEEFRKALLLAPWWADAYYNFGLAQDAADDPVGAMQSFKLFLSAAPSDPQARAVRDNIYALEMLVERITPLKNLEGKWRLADVGLKITDRQGKLATDFGSVSVRSSGKKLVIYNSSGKIEYSFTADVTTNPITLRETRECPFDTKDMEYFNKYCLGEPIWKRICTFTASVNPNGTSIIVHRRVPAVRCSPGTWLSATHRYERGN